MRKEYKWHLWNDLRGLWGRSCGKPSVSEWPNGSMTALVSKLQMKIMLVTFSISWLLFTFTSFHKTKQLTTLITWKYWSSYTKVCLEKGLNFGPRIDSSTVTMFHLTRNFLSSSFWPKNRLPKRNTPPPFPWLSSEWLLLFPKIKPALKGRRFLDVENIQKQVWRRHWKLLHNSSYKNTANSRWTGTV